MKSAIENLYYGNINPSERSIRRGSEYDRLLALLTQSEDTHWQGRLRKPRKRFLSGLWAAQAT